ncbi:threonine dehydratase [Sporolactobacillus inulinus]|uniref:Threonine dehydratase n=1 Tax=Sporolactobacillus inulinus TaxID=2078 RepID=A0A4Y1ZI42_9BACL|nr:threonine dehydratase [Sporolactobacillus inulinus]
MRGQHAGLIVSGGNADPEELPQIQHMAAESVSKVGTL